MEAEKSTVDPDAVCDVVVLLFTGLCMAGNLPEGRKHLERVRHIMRVLRAA
ncbi:hypothetical protein LVJ94_48525 [Pendulispora rubella]|uniref:Uncharacterized protein n=1 Tax=Pendulispora rubella TaxID=2741070 RepID=A0ABZ2L1K8_9BACT